MTVTSTYKFTEWKDPRPPGAEPIPGEFLLTFWAPIVGPSCVLILRAVGSCLRRRPEWRVSHADLGQMVGIRGDGKGSPLARSLVRLEHFGFLHFLGIDGRDGLYEVRLTAPELLREQADHLPGPLKLAHNLRRQQREVAS